MRIIIIKLGAVGDVLRTTSVLRGLREKYQPEQLDWLTKASGAEILLNNQLVDRIFTWDQRAELSDYDLIIGLEDDFETCQLVSDLNPARVLGAYVKDGKIGYTPSAWFEMSAISRLGLKRANELKKKNTKTFQQHMGELLGVKVGYYVFNLTGDEVEYGERVLDDLGIGKKEKVMGINTGAGKRWQMKELGIEKTIDLVKRITKELGVVSLILGGEEESGRNAIIAKETGMPNAGAHSLRNFASIINQCQLAVSSDSLAMHFAIALGKKLVVFFGPTAPAEIELYGLGAKVYPKMDCLVCYQKQCNKKPNCMEELSVDELFEEVKCNISAC